MTDLVGRSLARDDELPLAHPRTEAIDDRTGIPWINAWTDRRRQRRAERAAEAQTGMDYLISTPRRVVTSICRSRSSSSCCSFRSTGWS